MFTGIVKHLGIIKHIEQEGSNYHFTIEAHLDEPINIDQSIAHNGVCLTVVKMDDNEYVVTAIEETLIKTNLGQWKVGDKVNLELCLKAGQRMDGHFVQGHVDRIVSLKEVKSVDGSWYFRFNLPRENAHLVVSKGSICINGISLTVANLKDDEFTVAIIPYTYEHTNFHTLKVDDKVNIEFDILGKYILRNLALEGK